MASTTRVKLPLRDDVANLVMWESPKKSGVIFAGATLAFLFLQYGKYSFISLLAYGLSSAIFAMTLWHIVGNLIKRPPPPLPAFLTEGIAEAQLRNYADKVTPILNNTLSTAKHALDGSNPGFSLMAATVLFLVGKATAGMPFLAMAYLPVLAAFTVPKIYEMKKSEIDRALAIGRETATAINDKYIAPVLSKIPRAAAPSPAESSTMRKTE